MIELFYVLFVVIAAFALGYYTGRDHARDDEKLRRALEPKP